MAKGFKNLFGGGGSVVRVCIAGIIIAVLVVSFYYYLSHRLSSNEEVYSYESTELEEVLKKDFLKEYPETPKKVMEWYNRILMLYYSDDVGNTEVELLCDQARMLMDRELLADNSRLDFISAVKQEKLRYKERGRRISSATIIREKSSVRNRDNMASFVVLYSMLEKSTFSNTYQTYNLRRDGAGKYKIYSFAVTDEFGTKISL